MLAAAGDPSISVADIQRSLLAPAPGGGMGSSTIMRSSAAVVAPMGGAMGGNNTAAPALRAAPPVVPPPVPSVVAAMGSGLAPAPPLAVSGSALLSSASDPIVVGSRVTVVGDARELRAMIDSHVSVAWTDELARYVGVVGTVSMVDTDDSANVK